MLSFQRLDVYQRAIEFLSLAIEVVDELPRGHAERGDQLIRAAESVVRNIAEGGRPMVSTGWIEALQDRPGRSHGIGFIARCPEAEKARETREI